MAGGRMCELSGGVDGQESGNHPRPHAALLNLFVLRSSCGVRRGFGHLLEMHLMVVTAPATPAGWVVTLFELAEHLAFC